MFMIDLVGTEVSEEEKVILRHPNVGALILFTRNFSDKAQLQKLLETVRAIRPDIFVAIDHEGGIVQRFQRQGFRSLPAARVYGDVYDLDADTGVKLAQQYGEIMAKDLMEVGVDLSLAPVLDLHGVSQVIAKLDRAFHSDPEVVIKLATSFIEGMHKAGMPAVAKHFPGHGSVLSDSHQTMPVLEKTEEELRSSDLKPFITLMHHNLLNAVMPAHVIYTAIDPNFAAGYSKIWLQDILRAELNFQGLVISDCLGMAGADIGDMNTRANQALQAGCDMLIVCNQKRELLLEVLQTVSVKPTEESLSRLHTFKSKMRRFSDAKLQENSSTTTVTKLKELDTTTNIVSKADNSEFNQTKSI